MSAGPARSGNLHGLDRLGHRPGPARVAPGSNPAWVRLPPAELLQSRLFTQWPTARNSNFLIIKRENQSVLERKSMVCYGAGIYGTKRYDEWGFFSLIFCLNMLFDWCTYQTNFRQVCWFLGSIWQLINITENINNLIGQVGKYQVGGFLFNRTSLNYRTTFQFHP